MGLRDTKPWLKEDDKPFWQQSCLKCTQVMGSGRYDGRRTCLKHGGSASSPCPQFERSDLTEQEIYKRYGVKVEGRK